MLITLSMNGLDEGTGQKMSEHQTVEYKHIWRDEYLKWICGFANAQGWCAGDWSQ